MEPIDIVYGICRYYVEDHVHEVDPALVSRINGYRRSRNLAELASCSCHFDGALHTIREWRFLRQVEAFFKKNANLSEEGRCREAARISFFEAEHQCHLTNARLKPMVGFPCLVGEVFESQVQSMIRYIGNVLGDFQTFMDELPHLVKVTSGASATRSRRESLPQLKMRLKLYVTPKASRYLKEVARSYGFDNIRCRPIHTTRVELVPKNWKTGRTIGCEPEGNIPLQLAFDTYAKRRLRLFGINLSNQSANQKRARHASIHDSDVTVDFRSASDMVAYNTVSMLFPADWFEYLDAVRTPGYRGVFGKGTYAKFSSMGNGTTFAIETLLFAAACYAVGSRNFLVYGDDVIIEKEFYPAFLSLTRFLGFSVNEAKTYADGPFRESCGGDYFNGIDVAPVYIRGIDGRKANLCHLVNSIGSIAPTGGKLEEFLFSLVQEFKLPLVPFNESTVSGVWIDPGIARNLGILKQKHWIDRFKSYVPKNTRRMFVDSRGYYLWFLNKHRQVLFGGPWERNSAAPATCDETSSAPVFEHNYVRKRVGWIKPVEGTPDHVILWSERLVRCLKR